MIILNVLHLGMWGECSYQPDNRSLCQTTQDKLCPRSLEDVAERGCGEVRVQISFTSVNEAGKVVQSQVFKYN